jgi:hypothetical protein
MTQPSSRGRWLVIGVLLFGTAMAIFGAVYLRYNPPLSATAPTMP